MYKVPAVPAVIHWKYSPNSSAHLTALCVLLVFCYTEIYVHFMFNMLNVFIVSPVNLIFKQNIHTDLPKCRLGCRVEVYCSCNYSLWVHCPVGRAPVNLQCEQDWSPIGPDRELSPLSRELSPFNSESSLERLSLVCDYMWKHPYLTSCCWLEKSLAQQNFSQSSLLPEEQKANQKHVLTSYYSATET